MTGEEIMDIDLDIVNLLNKRPTDEGFGHYYISVNKDNVSSIGSGDAMALLDGFGSVLTREDEDSHIVRDAILSAVIAFLSIDKAQEKKFKKALKSIKQ